MVEITDIELDAGFARGSAGLRTGSLYSKHIKRIFDVSAVILAAPFVVPVVLLLAFLTSLDGNSAFYRQARVGRNGRIFHCWKLRTMVVSAEKRLEECLRADPAARDEWNHTQKLKRDPRITRLGRVLRKTSLDELPQLWNVLMGDMSLVGPRPMMPEQAEIYPGEAYYQMRPGITGLWQISDRNESAFAARAVHDNAYAKQMSLATDIGILFATVPVVLRGTGY